MNREIKKIVNQISTILVNGIDARRLLIKKVFLPVDILVCDTKDFNNRKDNLSTFEYLVATEGQKIYG